MTSLGSFHPVFSMLLLYRKLFLYGIICLELDIVIGRRKAVTGLFVL